MMESVSKLLLELPEFEPKLEKPVLGSGAGARAAGESVVVRSYSLRYGGGDERLYLTNYLSNNGVSVKTGATRGTKAGACGAEA